MWEEIGTGGRKNNKTSPNSYNFLLLAHLQERFFVYISSCGWEESPGHCERFKRARLLPSRKLVKLLLNHIKTSHQEVHLPEPDHSLNNLKEKNPFPLRGSVFKPNYLYLR